MSETHSKPRRKVVELSASPFRALQLISLVVLVASWLPGAAQARNSQILNEDESLLLKLRQQYETDFKAQQEEARPKPHLEQSTDGYEDYEVYREPFSETDDYLKFNHFVLGLKLDETYQFVDECLNNVIDAVDQRAYYENFMRDHLRMVANGTRSGFFQPYLNVSGIFAGPVSQSLPTCYSFLYSFYEVESTRFTTFGSNWGNFFLAFLFNQMGNALVFQSKFERIEEARERQDYPGMWQEYGDTIHLIWDFPPLEDSALDTVENFAERWLEDHEWLDEETPELKRTMMKEGVSTLARATHSAGLSFGDQLPVVKQSLLQTLQSAGEKRSAFSGLLAAVLTKTFAAMPPIVKQTVPSAPSLSDAGLFANGFFTGVTDVFPYESNVTRCSTNVTQGSTAFDRLFIKEKTLDWQSTDFQENLVTDLSYLLIFPYGVSYSCYYGYSSILINEDPMDDGVLTLDEELEQRIMVNNDITTNVLFNLGYMYSDLLTIYGLQETDANYWNNFGIYFGDFFVRFFWRRRFTRNFEYA